MQPRQRLSTRIRPAWGVPICAALLAVVAACYPSGVDSITDYNTVTTAYDTAFNFKALSTYSVPGITNPSNPNTCAIKDISDGGADFNTPNQATICTTVVNQLNALGYTLVSTSATDQPSFVVTIAGITQTYNAWVSYPWYGYWGGYYPGYPWGGWGVYYPYYTYVYSYDVGTLVLQMTTPDTAGSKMNGVWGAALNGVDTAPNNTPAVISAGITQAFSQSPYLGK